DRNRSHWSTSKTPSYTKSVSWQHHLRIQRSNADGNCLTGLFNVSKNIQHVNITNLHGRDLISEVDILGNEITLRPWQVMWIK
ncbi:sugar phosphorylase, partial [Escherichia coli]